MRRIHCVIGLLLFALLFFACRREVSYFGAPDNPASLPNPDPITAIVQGNVLDETGQPAAGAAVQAGNKTAVTDAKGYFRITEAVLDKKASLVTATKAGYFKAYRTFSATSGTNQVVIKLIRKALTGSVSAASGGEVALSNGSKIALPADGVVTASNNNAYTGTVNVYATYIDPASPDINQTVPGSFLAINKDGKRVLMASYGMMAVELESASGEKLQIKSGATATLTTAIPSAVQNSAPATIALWSVDEATGIWKEEGTATRNGNVYVGEVKHFSFWNCDVSMNVVVLSLTLKNSDDNPLVNAAVRIKRTTENGVSYGYGYTDSLGQVSGYVPANEPLVLEVLDECGAAFYSQNISSLTQSTNLGVITISNTGSSVVTIKGKLMNCSNAAVTDGYAIITYGNRVVYASANASGDFEVSFTQCGGSGPSSIDIVGIDKGSQQQSNSSSVAVSVPLTDAGSISACGTSAEQFIDYTLDGTNFSIRSNGVNDSSFYASSNDSLGTFLGGSTAPGGNQISFGFFQANLVPGNYEIEELQVQNYTYDDVTIIPPFNITLTKFPQATGSFYEGNFSGSFKDTTNITHTLSGTFRLRRVR